MEVREMSQDGFAFLKSVLDMGVRNQERRSTDFYSEDGTLMCGVCKKPRWSKRRVQIIGGELTEVICAVRCDCDEKAAVEEERKRIAEEDANIVRKYRSLSMMDDRYASALFQNFEVTKDNERNFRMAKRYVEKFDELKRKNQGLLFYGGVGTGKTYLSACIANELLDKKRKVVMTSFVNVVEASRDEDKYGKLKERIAYSELVLFDDLGAERKSEYATEKVYDVLDARYRQGAPMIITTNLSLTEMKNEVDLKLSRLYDRVFECCYPVQFTGQSWRRREAGRRFTEMQSLFEDL